jgi:hypothetical protein
MHVEIPEEGPEQPAFDPEGLVSGSLIVLRTFLTWSPKNGARCLDFFMKGRFGLNKKAERISHYLKGKSL